ncbi:MAG: putative bifunctional diguanylate cyclase/phosphodiesterase [Burkholderiaceae bacterium]
MQTSSNGDVEMLNPMASRLLMPLASQGNLDNVFTVMAPYAPQLQQMIRDFAPASGIVCEAVKVELGTGLPHERSPTVLSLSVLKVDSTRLMVSLTDVTLEMRREQDQLARELSHAARIDSLTGIPNRVELIEHLQSMLDSSPAAARRGALLFMNCDRFRQINDMLGPAAGDDILRLMGERLRTALRQHALTDAEAAATGDLVARIGSDEFVVVVDGVRTPDVAERVAQRLLKALAAPYGAGGKQFVCHFSMGIVVLNGQAGSAERVLQDASIAMREAKRSGGATYVLFEHAMRGRAEHRGDIEVALRRALAEDELFVVYQPVVGLRPDGVIEQCAGVEALVRWRHPMRGLVPPVEFIGIAEESGLIGALGHFVLATACEEFMRWQAELGPRAPRRLAVNLSRAQLTQPGLTQSVVAVLQATRMPASLLQLEVTESLAAQDAEVRDCLLSLQSLGIQLALDDFGTGYSSLACLHQMPVNTVKIDRSFVCHADTSMHHRVLIEATVMVAHSLGMDTVAEGIETMAQAAVVMQLGCDKGQGYLYGKPMEARDLKAWALQDLPAALAAC